MRLFQSASTWTVDHSLGAYRLPLLVGAMQTGFSATISSRLQCVLFPLHDVVLMMPLCTAARCRAGFTYSAESHAGPGHDTNNLWQTPRLLLTPFQELQGQNDSVVVRVNAIRDLEPKSTSCSRGVGVQVAAYGNISESVTAKLILAQSLLQDASYYASSAAIFLPHASTSSSCQSVSSHWTGCCILYGTGLPTTEPLFPSERR
ncbi:hypothetical protein DENSPDRAFT_99455 [Dentipellis sp. KUC8613]|nr:hypothetical protein DENSPDRAFT_99455 [Dentipellis sp. KUC8613]